MASSTLFYVSGLLLIVAVPVNMLATNHNFISLLINKHWVAGLADLSLLSMGVLICWCTIKLTRNKEAENSQKEMTNSLSPQEKQ